MKSYSVYFVRSDDPDALRAKLGQVDSRSLEPVAGSAWVVWRYHPDDGPPDDEVLWGQDSLTSAPSERLGEVVYLYADTSVDGFVYEHARAGSLIRKLVWFPMLGDEGTPGWLCAHGEPEPWEATLFHPERLTQVLAEERGWFEDRGESQGFGAREAEIRRIWAGQRIEAGTTVPRADGTVALLVERHLGLTRPERTR